MAESTGSDAKAPLATMLLYCEHCFTWTLHTRASHGAGYVYVCGNGCMGIIQYHKSVAEEGESYAK